LEVIVTKAGGCKKTSRIKQSTPITQKRKKKEREDSGEGLSKYFFVVVVVVGVVDVVFC